MIRLGKYSKAISYWEHNLAGIEHRLKPTEDDNIRFLKLKKEAQKADDESILFKGISELYFDLVMRAYPALPEQDQKDLKEVIGQNLPSIVEEMMIAFKWTTKEEIEKLKNMQINNAVKKKD